MLRIKIPRRAGSVFGGPAHPTVARAWVGKLGSPAVWVSRGALALALVAAFVSLGEDRDAADSVTSAAPIRVEPLGVPPVTPAMTAGTLAAGTQAAGTQAAGTQAAGTQAAETQAAGTTSTEATPAGTPERQGSGQVPVEASDHPSGHPAEYRPDHLLQLPASADSVLVFDLRENRMHLFERDGEQARHVGDTFVAVGKNGIDKQREGDEKTPIGLYYISSYIPGDTLPAIYGVGAYPIDYPNAWDRRRGRTGSGIWIHGTDKDDDSLLPKSSRGCLTLRNTDFETLSTLADIRRTPVIVSDQIQWMPAEDLETVRSSLAAALETWRQDWESLDTDRYLSHYSESFRTDSMSLSRWIAHKRRVNAAKSFIRVGVDDVGLYRYPGESELYLVTFEQSYRSNNFHSRKWKQQFWRREAGGWRIVHED